MVAIESGIRNINGSEVLPLDGLWDAVSGVSHQDKMKAALQYAGCTFYDDDAQFVAKKSIALVGMGGMPFAHEHESDEQIAGRMTLLIDGSREMMATSASFSYLNSGEKEQAFLYNSVTKLGHFSIAHTVAINLVVAGISEGAELELNLQRDLLHISKVTNARTHIQTRPPIVVPDKRLLPLAQALEASTVALTQSARAEGTPDELEMINSFHPINKATIVMLSGDLSNFRKVAKLRDDTGKESELRDIADKIHSQLQTLWPEIYNNEEK